MRSSPSEKKVAHRCVKCGKEFPHGLTPFCDCGGMIDVHYDLRSARLYESTSPYVRYFDLLPVERPENLVPVDHEMTPTVHAKALGKALGLPWLYLKNETVFPTRTTKDRMAVVVLSFFRDIGVRTFAASSTGNSTTALAHCLKGCPGDRGYLFIGEDFLPRLNSCDNERVTVFALRGGTFVEAGAECVRFGERRGIATDRGFFNPAKREGLKLAFLEAAEAIPRPIDWYVQAVSSAMGVYGVYKGAKELLGLNRLARLPRLLCVQQTSCCPMVEAFEAGSDAIRPQDIVKHPRGIASAILRGDPTRVYPYVRKDVIESGGTFVAVSEPEIRAARQLVEELEGISICFTSATAVAGLIRLTRRGDIPTGNTVLINLTGADREPGPLPRNLCWLRRTASGWAPQLEEGPWNLF